ncbi:MAG: hypothetical protein NZM12_03805 [Steroidobacteraceae bacterium]|nr:hypothetical protein [Steroidobacteraceae bacterium]MDW8259556.1 alpha/beta hydrolase [Gammaproteobacteria bacterium]
MPLPPAHTLFVQGPAGALETVLEEPQSRVAGHSAFGVICHPHPLGGGALTNKVVHTLARVFRERGVPTLRFNFRGVGRSGGAFDGGAGEREDALAIVAFGRERWPGSALWLAGFSFGAWIALGIAAAVRPERLVTVAPPVGRWDFAAIPPPQCPWLIVQGAADELVDAAAVAAWAEQSPARPRLALLPDTGHFFHGRLAALGAVVLSFLDEAAGQQKSS